jgi:phosphatidylserine/phosphatidylglycerophosphate/cardiolipin synthase-like enzyme
MKAVTDFLKKAGLLLAILGATFGAGTWYGHSLPPSGIDPQAYMHTVFTPYEDGMDAYLKFLDGAKRKVRVGVYSFTLAPVTDKLIELHQKGVKDIKVLVDLSQSVGRSGKYQQAQIERLRAEGIEVVIGTSEKSHQIMHLKFTVVDDEWTEDGSWNYTASANKQDNDLNFVQSKQRAAFFTAMWERMYNFMKNQDQTPWVKPDANQLQPDQP